MRCGGADERSRFGLDGFCIQTRLNLYKRLAAVDQAEQIDALREEITERFGELRIERDTLEAKDRAQLIRDVLRSLGAPKVAVSVS